MIKTIFITGSSSGIGKATAKLFHEKGWNVVATMRRPEKESELNTKAVRMKAELKELQAKKTREVARKASTTLADLLTPLLVANPSSAMRAPLLWWLGDKFEDGLTHGGQRRLRWRPVDSFFPVLLF